MYRVIFEHHPTEDKVEEFIKQWKAGSDIIQTYPGARGTLLFKSLENPDIYYAMAEWGSKEMRDKAMEEISGREDADWVMHKHEKFVDKYSVIVSTELIDKSTPPNY